MSSRSDHFNFLQRIFYRIVSPYLSDAAYANMSLNRWFGIGNVAEPVTFNEKLQWLKIYDRNPLYVTLADKYAVRGFVRERIGDGFLNELYGAFESPSQIDWAALPKSFVLKATHGSYMNILVEDKDAIDKNVIHRKLNRWLQIDYSRIGREWVYRGIPRRIIAERLLRDASGNIPIDYKIFCFNGAPTFIQVDIDRFGAHKRAYFDIEWRRQPFSVLHEPFDGLLDKPESLDRMVKSACVLARDIPFVRVDFYALPQLIFGEMTFYPEGGTGPFLPVEWDFKLGQLLKVDSADQ